MAQESTKARESRRKIVERLNLISKTLSKLGKSDFAHMVERLEVNLTKHTVCAPKWESIDERIWRLIGTLERDIRDSKWSLIEGDCQRIEELITKRDREVRQNVEKGGFFAWLSGSRQTGNAAMVGDYEKLSIEELEDIQHDLEDEIDDAEREMAETEDEIFNTQKEQAKVQAEGRDAQEAGNTIALERLNIKFVRLKNQIADNKKKIGKLGQETINKHEILRVLKQYIEGRKTPAEKDKNLGSLMTATEKQVDEMKQQEALTEAALDDINKILGDDIKPREFDADFLSGLNSFDNPIKSKETIKNNTPLKYQEEN